MKQRMILLTGIITLALIFMIGACAAEENTTVTATVTETAVAGATPAGNTGIDDDIAPYNGPFGLGNPLYGLKIAFEDLDESFTFNETERLNKQMNNARLRLSEVKREFILNNTGAADQALDLYWQKVNLTQMRLNVLSSSNETGLLHAQEMVTKHQAVLEGLMLSHPNNTGLARAYNNSLALERKFEEKTRVRFERVIEKDNRTIVQAVRLEVKEQERTENAGENQTERIRQTQQIQQAERTEKPETPGGGRMVTERQTAKPVQTTGTARITPSPAATPGNTGNARPQNTGNSDNDNNGQGNGRNR